jgi:FKBP-type peptidyl-prolyl cis-trans isomerase FkpA
MKMNRWLVMMIAMMILASSCTNNKDFTVTKSGLGYKIFPGGGKDSLKPGSMIRFRLWQKIEDSLLNVPDESPDRFAKIDPVPQEFDIWEIAKKLTVGDSIVYRFPVDTIFSKSPNAPPGSFPSYLKKGKNMYLNVKILKKYDSVQQIESDYRAEMARIQDVIADKRKKEFEKIAKEKFQDAIKTPGGTLVKITQQGTGPAADTGKIISIKYEGRFTNGQVFDGNMNQKDTALSKPAEFLLARGYLIQGWIEALPLLKKGGKASVFVPYEQAYGPMGDQRAIPGFSNLLFDLEIVDVKDAPKAPANSQGNK